MMTGTEVIRTLVFLIFESLWKTSGRALSQMNEGFQQVIFRASGQYSKNYRERHGTLKVLGMREPVELDSVYVAVQFLDDAAIHDFASIEALEQTYRKKQRRSFQLRERHDQSGIEVANQTPYLMVLGGPGVGKSTFLRKIGLEALKDDQERSYDHQCIPVFIDLKEFRRGKLNLLRAIAHEFSICGFPEAEGFAQEALEQGKLLVLLDGLDEVPTEYTTSAIASIQNFVDHYDKNRFIASCRIAAYRHNFRRFTDVRIADFDDDQLHNFVTNWFKNEPERGQECLTKLMSDEHGATRELAHTPMLLTLTCLLYQRAGQFPTNRATLYEKALRVFLEEWAGEKGIHQESLYRGLDTKRKELMLAEIAYEAFAEDRLFLSRRELARKIETLLGEMLPDESFIDGIAVLRSIEVQHGILVERAEGIYSFSHLTLQEFLTAQHILECPGLVEGLIHQHLDDPRWREVFLLLAGLKQADDLLQRMEQQVDTYIQSQNLRNLLLWADQITDQASADYKPGVRRAIAIFLALDLAQVLALDSARIQRFQLDIDRARMLALAMDRNLTLNCALDLAMAKSLDLDRAIDLVVNIARKFEAMQVFPHLPFNVLIARLEALRVKFQDQPNTFKTRRILVEQIHKSWLEVLQLKPEWIKLSQPEAKALDRYLYANLLIVHCRQAAVRVSAKTWNAIEAGILRVKGNREK
jgi:hypothetical protein